MKATTASLLALGLFALDACGSGDAVDSVATAETACTTGAPRVLAEPVNWPESPIFTQGTLKYVAYGSHDVWTSDGRTSTVFWHEEGCGPSAVTVMDDGDLFVTCYDSNSLAHLSAKGEKRATIAQDADGNALVGPNDFARDAKGGLYFSASGVFDPAAPVAGKVYYRAASGSVREVAKDIHYSNGLVVTNGGRSLLVAEHLEAQILEYRIGNDGSLSDRRVWARLRDLVPTPTNAPWSYGCDGIRKDSKGNVYIANYAGSRVIITNPAGRLLTTVTTPYPFVDNMTVGPALGRGARHGEEVLYISALRDDSAQPYPGAIFEVRNPVQ